MRNRLASRNFLHGKTIHQQFGPFFGKPVPIAEPDERPYISRPLPEVENSVPTPGGSRSFLARPSAGGTAPGQVKDLHREKNAVAFFRLRSRVLFLKRSLFLHFRGQRFIHDRFPVTDQPDMTPTTIRIEQNRAECSIFRRETHPFQSFFFHIG